MLDWILDSSPFDVYDVRFSSRVHVDDVWCSFALDVHDVRFLFFVFDMLDVRFSFCSVSSCIASCWILDRFLDLFYWTCMMCVSRLHSTCCMWVSFRIEMHDVRCFSWFAVHDMRSSFDFKCLQCPVLSYLMCLVCASRLGLMIMMCVFRFDSKWMLCVSCLFWIDPGLDPVCVSSRLAWFMFLSFRLDVPDMRSLFLVEIKDVRFSSRVDVHDVWFTIHYI